jgi:hypothetical protein
MSSSTSDRLDLNDKVFDMVSSTASRVDPDAPTRFRYAEAEGVVWGEYTGDTVTVGRFAGVRTGDRLEVSFVHTLVAGGAPVRGTAVSRIEEGRDGLLRLVEEFEADGRPQTSVCQEVPSVL